MNAELVVFVIVAPLSLATAISMVALRNAVHAALMLVGNFFTLAVLYAVLEAQFLAVVQIIVYAGAIMVLFLFVIMLLGVEATPSFTERLPGQKAAAALLGVALLVALTGAVAGPYLGQESVCTATEAEVEAAAPGAENRCVGLAGANAAGNVRGVGELVFIDFVWPFEVTSVLLVIAALGALVLGRKTEDPSELIDMPRRDLLPAPVRTAPRQVQLEESRQRSHAREGTTSSRSTESDDAQGVR